MENKKESTELTKPKSDSSLLTYEEYRDTLTLAKKIRLENEDALKKAITPKEKTTLLEQLFIKYNIPANASSNTKDKELATLLKINIFIPDNEKFIKDYKTEFGKNVRLISDAYQIPAPFVFQKVTEIGKYEQYLNRIKKEGGIEELESNPAQKTISPEKPDTSKTVSSSPSKDKKSKKKNSKKEEKAPIAEDKQPVESPKQTDISGIVSEQVLQHLDSMQRYCTRLLDQNEQLSAQNASLVSFRKELETLLGKLREENNMLKGQMSTLAKENGNLVEQVEKLTQENITLTSQVSIEGKEQTTRTIAEETATEKELRQEIKGLQCQNQELKTQLEGEQEKKEQYKARAILAEVQLEQFEHGMQGIFKEVDALDFDLTADYTKKS